MVGDPVKGQALVATIAMIYGLFVAVTGPFLGASIDKIGRRKPLLLLMTALLMLPLLLALWWIKPGHGRPWASVSARLILGLLAACSPIRSFCTIRCCPERRRPSRRPTPPASALSLGNFFSVFMLVFVLWAFALPGKVDVGLHPQASAVRAQSLDP